jgi:hypothetical protein
MRPRLGGVALFPARKIIAQSVEAVLARAVAFHDAPRLGQIGKSWATQLNPEFFDIESPPRSAALQLM